MAKASTRLTFMPPEESLDELTAFLDMNNQIGVLIGAEDAGLALPPAVCRALRDIAFAMAQGQAVTITSHHQRLTTQEAAELLGVSRPTFVKMLDDGLIPFEQPGKHRRVLLKDVLEYQRHTRRLLAALDDGRLA